MSYVLRALDNEGNRYFYTGTAGLNWLSFEPENAFEYQGWEAACNKAKTFNKMEPVHGYWFLVHPRQPGE
jgi:hypothetical protein